MPFDMNQATDLDRLLSVTISSGQSLSSAYETRGLGLIGIIAPSAWDAANLTFQASVDNVVFNNVFDSLGVEAEIVFAINRFIPLEPKVLLGAFWLKVRSGTSGTPVVQTANRVLTLVFRPV